MPRPTGFPPACGRTGFQPVIAERSGRVHNHSIPYRLLLCVFISLLTPTLAAHPFHETLTQFEHNAQNQTLELAVRIDAIDLEQMVERWLGERINLETDPRAERSIELWLRERLSARLPTGERSALAWIGHEFDGAFCWVYVEFAVPPEAEWLDLAHIVLFDWHPSPTNTIVGLAKNSGQSYATTLEQPIARIRLTGEGETRIWWRVVLEFGVAVWRAIQARTGGMESITTGRFIASRGEIFV